MASVALQVVKLRAFSKFDSTVDALTSTAAIVDSKSTLLGFATVTLSRYGLIQLLTNSMNVAIGL